MIAADRVLYLQMRIARFDDQHAYKELFTSFYSYLFQFAFSFVKSQESAEEVVSDVFIKIWEKRKALEKINNLKVYLYVATKNNAFNYIDKQKRNATNSIDDFPAEFASRYFDPEQLLITADMLALIEDAINNLPPRCRAIFKLIKEDNLKYKEVAEILNISVKTVENQLAIALRKIGSAVSFDIKKTISSPVNHP
ncbi:MAG: RNA polymerase sigma-70 factor [Bacteroidetes bacterium]|nr:RNA polymerase sigma-70 factor [Bacteroidota bacterium]MBS1933181.1 RNA polymerase sigma-70 factor [Bacteroidota bacterium]